MPKKTDKIKEMPIKGTTLGELLKEVMKVEPPKKKAKPRKKTRK